MTISEQLDEKLEELRKDKAFLEKVYRALYAANGAGIWDKAPYSQNHGLGEFLAEYSMRQIIHFRFEMMRETWLNENNDKVDINTPFIFDDDFLLFFLQTGNRVEWEKSKFWEAMLDSEEECIPEVVKVLAGHFFRYIGPQSHRYGGSRLQETAFYGIVEFKFDQQKHFRWENLNCDGLHAFYHHNYAAGEIVMDSFCTAEISDWFGFLLAHQAAPEIIFYFLKHHENELGLSGRNFLRYVCKNYQWTQAQKILEFYENLHPGSLRAVRDESGHNLLFFVRDIFPTIHAVYSDGKNVLKTYCIYSGATEMENCWSELEKRYNPVNKNDFRSEKKELAQLIAFLEKHGVSRYEKNILGYSFHTFWECHYGKSL